MKYTISYGGQGNIRMEFDEFQKGIVFKIRRVDLDIFRFLVKDGLELKVFPLLRPGNTRYRYRVVMNYGSRVGMSYLMKLERNGFLCTQARRVR